MVHEPSMFCSLRSQDCTDLPRFSQPVITEDFKCWVMINLAVLHRSALLDMDQMDLPLFAPAQEMATRQFRPVAAPSRFRHTPMLDHHL
jgi:hypothetical protein